MKTIGAMATIPEREHVLPHSVASILPQVDELFVYLNGFEHTP